MNPGEDGQPHAVLVGKDGQEVNKSAGEGVVEILRQRDVEAKGEDDRVISGVVLLVGELH
jgi:hypothetical protein